MEKIDNNKFKYKCFEWHSKFHTSLKYSQQLEYILVLESCTHKQATEIDIDNQHTLQFIHQIAENTDTGAKIPSVLPTINWPIQGQTQNIYKITQNNEILTPATPPSGDETLSLHHHMKHIVNKGYIDKKKCNNCNTMQNCIIKPSINKIPPYCMVYIDQNESNYYQFVWSGTIHRFILPTKPNKDIELRSQLFISQYKANDYSVQWRNENQEWYKMNNENVTSIDRNTQDWQCCTQNASLLMFQKFNIN